MFEAGGSAERELFAGGIQSLLMSIRLALPTCFGSDLPIRIDAIRDLSVFSKFSLAMLQQAQPRVLGTKGLAAAGLVEWAKCLLGLSGNLQTIVVSSSDGLLERDGLLQRLLGALPSSLQALDLHYLDARLQGKIFPLPLTLPHAT